MHGDRGAQLEVLLETLFRLQDLAGDGLLDELELVKLNEKIAMLHHGVADNEDIKTRYQRLFRTKLDPNGKPVAYGVFRKYMVGVLDELDPDENAQEMIVESFIKETRLARRAFYQVSMKSEGDTPFRPKLSDMDEWSVYDLSEERSPSHAQSSPTGIFNDTKMGSPNGPKVRTPSDTRSSPPKTPCKGGDTNFTLAITPPPVDLPSTQQANLKNCSHQERNTSRFSTPLSVQFKYSEIL